MTPLSARDQTLLRAATHLVPPADRGDFARTWHAELWHARHRRRPVGLSLGLVQDALWLRVESWRRGLAGTAILCLGTLLGFSVLSALVAIVLKGSWRSLTPELTAQFYRTLSAAPLVVIVAFLNAPRRHVERAHAAQHSLTTGLYWIKRQLFFALKVLQLLLLAFLLSTDLTQPLQASFANTATLFQLVAFVILSLLGLRWAFHDQDNRCKQCLQALTTPARIGRPSHNLLEWNGTELACKKGHGHLSVPEIETSWCQSSQWTPTAG